MKVKCKSCQGTGRDGGCATGLCETCNATGKVDKKVPQWQEDYQKSIFDMDFVALIEELVGLMNDTDYDGVVSDRARIQMDIVIDWLNDEYHALLGRQLFPDGPFA